MENQKFIIKSNQTILEALEKLNNLRNTSRIILFVVSNDDVIIGSLTDGDIRRSLIIDKDLNKLVGEVCFRNFIYRIKFC